MQLRITGWTLALLSNILGPRPTVKLGREIQVQRVPGKGLGVFATCDLPAGAFLGRYTGEMLRLEDALEAWTAGETSGDYFALLNGAGSSPLVIDAEDYRKSSWPRFINHSKRRANCKILELRQPLAEGVDARVPLGLYVQTSRDIRAGEELLISYGDAYWDDRGFPMWNPRRWLIDYL